jgi:hypothetical protein
MSKLNTAKYIRPLCVNFERSPLCHELCVENIRVIEGRAVSNKSLLDPHAANRGNLRSADDNTAIEKLWLGVRSQSGSLIVPR